mgnify:CR=1 FL=1
MNFIRNLIFNINYLFCRDTKTDSGYGLYIRVDENKKWLMHPHHEINVFQLHPYHIFLFGPPKGWMRFNRVKPPRIGVYQYFDPNIGAGPISGAFSHNGLEYGIVDGKYTDIWHVKDMTEEEILEKQNEVKEWWKSHENDEEKTPWGFPSWIFNEKECFFEPPYPCPGIENGCMSDYDWNEETVTWDRIFENQYWTGIEGHTRFYIKIVNEMKENNCNKIVVEGGSIVGYENSETGERFSASEFMKKIQGGKSEPASLYGE